MSAEIRDHVLSIVADIEQGTSRDKDGKYATWVLEWFEAERTSCAHCANEIDDRKLHHVDAPDAEDVSDVHEDCHQFEGEDLPSAFDYMRDVLDIEYVIGSDGQELRGARFLVSFGGPTIWINTRNDTVEGYWWSDRHTENYSDGLDLGEFASVLWSAR